MTVDKLNHNKLMITLCSEDMHDFKLDYTSLSLYDYHSRKILMRILNLACFKMGIDAKNKKMLVEALPFDNCCVILLTLVRNETRSYRIKSSIQNICYLLGNCENFLETVRLLYLQNVCCNKNSVYFFDGNYYIVFDYPAIPHKFKKILSEYAEKRCDELTAPRLRENGREICKTNAISQIGRFL